MVDVRLTEPPTLTVQPTTSRTSPSLRQWIVAEVNCRLATCPGALPNCYNFPLSPRSCSAWNGRSAGNCSTGLVPRPPGDQSELRYRHAARDPAVFTRHTHWPLPQPQDQLRNMTVESVDSTFRRTFDHSSNSRNFSSLTGSHLAGKVSVVAHAPKGPPRRRSGVTATERCYVASGQI